MSALAKAVLAFNQRPQERLTRHGDLTVVVPLSTLSKWVELARADEASRARPVLAPVGAAEHHATCLCAACRARREATASHLPVQPNNLPSSGPREPERAPEGVADGAAAASTRSQAAASPRSCRICGEDVDPSEFREDPSFRLCTTHRDNFNASLARFNMGGGSR